MKNKDITIRLEIEKILQNNSSGDNLKCYFENLPDNKIRRTIAILSTIYPDKKIISDNDFDFIIYMFSKKIFLEQESFFEFIRSLNIIDFTENQKSQLIDVIKTHFLILCENCTFELDDLLIKIFNHSDLFEYLKILSKDNNTAVLQHILNILRYNDFSSINISDVDLQELKQEVFHKL